MEDLRAKIKRQIPSLSDEDIRSRVRTLHSYLFHHFAVNKRKFFPDILRARAPEFGFHFGRSVLQNLGVETPSSVEQETEDDLSYLEAIRLRNLGLSWERTSLGGRPALQVKRLFVLWDQAWAKGFWDFQRLIELGCREQGLFTQSLVGFDETNDFTPSMFQIVRRSEARQTLVACDPDQSIYSWNGAKPEDVFTLPFTKTTLLEYTNRVPSVIATAADKILDRASFRAPGRMKSTREGGTCKNIFSIYKAFPLIRGTEAFILTRTNHIADKLAKIAISEFKLNVNRTIDNRALAEAINGKYGIDEEARRQMLRLKSENFKKNGKDILRGMRRIDRRELLRHVVDGPLADALMCRDIDLLELPVIYHEPDHEKPLIEVFTKHACKGLEAENVVVADDTTRRIDNEGKIDDEIRLQYVAVTRAKNAVFEVEV